MSADNGVYILKTPKGDGYEYRVAELQAIDNLSYNRHKDPGPHCPESGWYTDKHDPEKCPQCCAWRETFNSKEEDVLIENARKMWGNCTVYTNESDAFHVAYQKYRQLVVCEYGIRFVEINKEF